MFELLVKLRLSLFQRLVQRELLRLGADNALGGQFALQQARLLGLVRLRNCLGLRGLFLREQGLELTVQSRLRALGNRDSSFG